MGVDCAEHQFQQTCHCGKSGATHVAIIGAASTCLLEQLLPVENALSCHLYPDICPNLSQTISVSRGETAELLGHNAAASPDAARH
eukprot:6468159-Amphidinium_carterae.1